MPVEVSAMIEEAVVESSSSDYQEGYSDITAGQTK